MKRELAVVLSLLLVTAGLPFLFLWHMNLPSSPEQLQDQEDLELGRMVRSLHSVQMKREASQHKQRSQTLAVIREKFPWAMRNNSLPNYFLLGGLPSQATSHQWTVYQRGALVFLHHHRSAGTAFRQCLDSIGKENSFAMSPVMTSDSRQDWDDRLVFDTTYRDRLKVHRGQFTFGMCGDVRRPCSYFTLLRDPLARAVSSYKYCKEALADEMCSVLNANKVTLKQWILHHGSLLFQQLVFNSDWCHQVVNTSAVAQKENMINTNRLPCWYKHKLQMSTLTGLETKHLLDHVLASLDQWLAVVGLVEDLESSMLMFEHVYKLPFTQCGNIKKFDTNFNVMDNSANRKKRRESWYDDNDPEYLYYDYDVRGALDADYRIYKKAKKIFQLQKQILLNKVSR